MSSGFTDLTIAFNDTSSPTWANKVRDRVINPMDNASDRSTNIPSPTEGMAVYMNDSNTMLVHDGTNWVQPASLRENSSVQTSSTSGTTTYFAGQTVTFTAKTGRRYKVTYSGHVHSTGSDQFSLILTYKAGATVASTDTILIERTSNIPTANVAYNQSFSIELTGITGQYTIGTFLKRTFGGGTFSFNANSTEKLILLVEDIGV